MTTFYFQLSKYFLPLFTYSIKPTLEGLSFLRKSRHGSQGSTSCRVSFQVIYKQITYLFTYLFDFIHNYKQYFIRKESDKVCGVGPTRFKDTDVLFDEVVNHRILSSTSKCPKVTCQEEL